MPHTATLTDWKIENNYGTHRLVGTITGVDRDGRFVDGDVIYTSRLLYVDFDRMEARTKNSFYKLA